MGSEETTVEPVVLPTVRTGDSVVLVSLSILREKTIKTKKPFYLFFFFNLFNIKLMLDTIQSPCDGEGQYSSKLDNSSVFKMLAGSLKYG